MPDLEFMIVFHAHFILRFANAVELTVTKIADSLWSGFHSVKVSPNPNIDPTRTPSNGLN